MNYCIKCKNQFIPVYYIIDDYLIDDQYCKHCTEQQYNKFINTIYNIFKNLYSNK